MPGVRRQGQPVPLCSTWRASQGHSTVSGFYRAAVLGVSTTPPQGSNRPELHIEVPCRISVPAVVRQSVDLSLVGTLSRCAPSARRPMAQAGCPIFPRSFYLHWGYEFEF